MLVWKTLQGVRLVRVTAKDIGVGSEGMLFDEALTWGIKRGLKECPPKIAEEIKEAVRRDDAIRVLACKKLARNDDWDSAVSLWIGRQPLKATCEFISLTLGGRWPFFTLDKEGQYRMAEAIVLTVGVMCDYPDRPESVDVHCMLYPIGGDGMWKRPLVVGEDDEILFALD